MTNTRLPRQVLRLQCECGAAYTAFRRNAKRCPSCNDIATEARRRAWRDANRDLENARARARRAENPTPSREAGKRSRLKHPRPSKKKERYWANPEKFRKEARDAYQRDPEKCREHSRRYRDANREKCRQARRDAYHASEAKSEVYVERSRRAARAWYRANTHRAKASAYRRRARLRDACSPGVTAAEWAAICEQFSDGETTWCAYCEKPATQIDHVRPIFHRGADSPDNVVPACKSCNSSKGKKILLWQWVGKDVRSVRLAVE